MRQGSARTMAGLLEESPERVVGCTGMARSVRPAMVRSDLLEEHLAVHQREGL
jgi:hypothetical protein